VIAQVCVDDEGGALRDAVAGLLAASVDAVIFSGGVSAGAFEVVRTELAAAMTFSRVAMQPGKPQGFGTLPTPAGVALLFGLPGNPSARPSRSRCSSAPPCWRCRGDG
jgi:molybdopterin molybdotransferase